MEGNVLSVKSLSVEFFGKVSNNKVVSNLSFDLNEGETLAIVGESGSGKSVSSLSILQLLNPENSVVTGDIILRYEKTIINLLDLDLNKISKYRGEAISMIFQEPMAALNPVLKCGEQVAEIISVHQKKSKAELHANVIQLFKEVELPRPEEMFDNYPYQLSGGQQQRVMIAMALANNPVLLIADEPTTALDPLVQDEILGLIKRLQKKNKMAMLFISHDLDAVKKVADKVLVMQMGEVKESGSAYDVFTNPKHPYTRGLLNCKPGVDKKGLVLPTVNDFLRDPLFKPRELKDKLLGETIIALENVSVVYKTGGLLKKQTEVIAIRDVSISLRKGETVGVIGPSGCGKTTTGRVLAGWIPPTSGQVIFNGVPTIMPGKSPGKKWAREVQLIFQDPFGSLNPKIKIGDAIAEPMLVHGLADNTKHAREKVCYLLEKVGLRGEHFDRYPHEFSGGQRQRIVIARALAVEPKVLVCDESVAALDVSVQAQVLNLLNDLQREMGLTYLFISHDHNVIGYFCDRIVEMDMGSVKSVSTQREELKPISVQRGENVETSFAKASAVVEPVEPTQVNVLSVEEPVKPDALEPEPIWKQHLKEERTYDTLVSSVNPGDSIADQVSAELLRMRLEADHKKMERLAEEISIPKVSDIVEDEDATIVELIPVETEPVQQQAEAIELTAEPEIITAIIPEIAAPVEIPEPITPEPEIAKPVAPQKNYSKLSEFIKGNSSAD